MKTSVFKKAVALLVCALMLFSTLVISAGAATVATLTVAADGDSYNVGDTVKVTASVSGAGSFQSMGLTIAYDDVLKLVGGGWLAEDAVIADYTVGNAKAAMTFEADTAFSGDVFYLEFVVLEAATFGDYNVTLTPVIKTEAGAVVECAAGTATVTVACAHGMGDVAYDDEYHWDECADCGEDLNKAVHEFDNACDSTCSGCEYTREVGDHVYDNDCDAECNICGAIREVGDHVYDNDCDANCNNCGEVREVGDHTWGDYDYDDDGHWQTCVNGDATTEKTGHTYGDWIVETPATNTTTGVKYRECVCGHKETAVIPATMKFASATLTLESSITINYKVKPEYFTNYGYTDHYVVFTFDDDNGVPYDTVVSDYRIEGTGSSQRYVFEFNGVKSFQMTQTVVATLYATYNGELYSSAPQEYSVATYCYNRLEKSDDEVFKTMIVDLLNYGTEAQLLWEHKTDDLANAALTPEQAALGSTTTRDYVDSLNTTHATISNATATWKSASLIMYDAVIIRMRFITDDISGITAKITNDNGDEWIVNNEDIVWNADAGRYEVYFDGLYAMEMSDVVYFTLYRDGVATSNTIAYSIESYVARNTNASQTALLEAMMRYGDSAVKYFG